MKLVFFMSLITGFLFGPLSGYGFTCPEWIGEKQNELPECPEGQLVPESFPLGAIVVSDMSQARLGGADFAADVVKKVLRNAGDKNPLLILPVSSQTLKSVQDEIKAMDVSLDLKEKWLKSIIHIPNASYTWQQDFMQSFIDSNSGKLQLRKVEGYLENRGMPDYFSKIIEPLQKCGIESGPALKTQWPEQGFKGGYSGGNIEVLPGGICLLGDDSLDPDKATSVRWNHYADQICESGEDHRIKVPTYWLQVGHTDEIVKVLPNKTQEKPCDFSVAVSSPRKALELLRRNSKDNFFDFSNVNEKSLKEKFSRKMASSHSLAQVCHEALKSRDGQYLKRKRRDEQPSKAMSDRKKWYETLIKTANASGFAADPIDDCMNITNGEVAELFGQKEMFGEYNNNIQVELDRLKKEMKDKLSQKLPQCDIDIFDVPDLYVGGRMLHLDGGTPQLSRGMGVSLMPNSTNGITVDNASLHSDPHVDIFKKHISEENQKRGLKTEFVDTFEYAHVGLGNLHCSTNTMYICKPRGAK